MAGSGFRRNAAAAIAVLLILSGTAAEAGEFLFDAGKPYRQRIEGVTSGAGNAKEANTAMQMFDPWPPYARKRRIRTHGERMAGAVERYRDVRRLPTTPQPLAPAPIGLGIGGAATTATPPVVTGR